MNKPSDHVTSGDEVASSESPMIRKAPMIDPGFREEVPESVLRPRILGVKKPSHPKDRRNLKLFASAIVLAVLIFGVLQYKQMKDAEREPGTAVPGLFDFLK